MFFFHTPRYSLICHAFLSEKDTFIFMNIRPIKIKKHGFRAKSYFKYGLDFIANKLLNAQNQSDVDIFRFLSCS